LKALSRVELEALVGAMPAAAVVIGKDAGKVIYANDKASKLFGVNFLGLAVPDQTEKLVKFLTLDGNDYPFEKRPIYCSLMGEEAKDELIIQRANGSRVIASVHATPVRDKKGKVVAAFSVLEDITERKKAVDALRDSEQRFKLVAEVAKVLVYEINLEQGSIVISRGEDVLGYLPGEIPTKEEWWLDQVHPNDRQSTQQKLRKATQASSDYCLEYQIRRKQGDYIFARDTGKAVLNDEGRVIRFVGGMRDVTERKKWENDLKESEQRLKFHYENSPLAVVEWDANFVVTRWAGEAQAMFGWTAAETVGKPIMDLHMIYEPDIPIVERTMGKLTDGVSRRVTSSNRNVTKDGKLLYCTWYNSVLYGNDGKMVSVMSLVEDKTATVRARVKLKKYAAELEREVAERAKELQDKERLAAIGATAGMVGHDIRNPLQAIAGDVYLLKLCLAEAINDCETKIEVTESLDGIDKNIQYINKIVLDLQDYARQLVPEYKNVNLTDIVKETLKAVDVPDNIRVTNNAGYIELKTDAQFIRRALTNLLNNAVQAMPNGGNLTVGACERKKWVILTVEDTGAGIPDKVKAKLFTPMMTTKAKGQGLGLAVVKRLVEALGGTISFESEDGKGTKFIIELPIS
jgi:PAS domain S-box-containing protein